ncbi:MAG TPA: mechanosensitive ion channel family protein [Phycisphaerae bacterium]|nr:mechanosensitive ion channel family protein [Phycisphaerae bacterium]
MNQSLWLHWAISSGAILLLGAILLFFLRRFLGRLKLHSAYVIGVIAAAVYFGALIINLFPALGDVGNYWLDRLIAALFLFSALRVIDRLLVVPLLTRGGKISLPRFFHQIINIVLLLFAILGFGSWAFGWDIDRFLAGSAVVSIVLGLALQETLGNFFSGLVMQASPPFEIGHRIKILTFEGDVVDMTWRAVTILTDEDDYIIIPNGTVAKSEILNYSIPTRATARFVRVGLEYDLPPADAIAVLRAAANETAEVLKSPEPVIYLEDFAESSVNYAIKFWITNAKEHEIIQHNLRVHVWYRLKERGYNIPFPVRTVEHSSHAAKNRQLQSSARSRRIDAINRVPLLDPLTPEQKRDLADSTNELYLTAGQILFRQKDSGDSFYIIYKGEVEVLVTPEGAAEERLLATLRAGDFFGEMSALTGQPRSATIRAKTPLACVQIEKRDLLAIFERDPAIMEKISAIVARRNAEREAAMQGGGKTPEPEAVSRQQKSILGRMMSFFGLAKAA